MNAAVERNANPAAPAPARVRAQALFEGRTLLSHGEQLMVLPARRAEYPDASLLEIAYESFSAS